MRSSTRRKWYKVILPHSSSQNHHRTCRGRCPSSARELQGCPYIPRLTEYFGAGSSGGNVLVPARTLIRSRLKGRCRKAAPVRKHWINCLRLWADLFRPLFIRKSGKYIQYSSAFSASTGRKISRSQLLPIYPVLPPNPPAAPPEAGQNITGCHWRIIERLQIECMAFDK